MNLKEYATEKFKNVRDRAIVLREMLTRGFSEDSEIHGASFMKNWEEVVKDLEKMYADGLAK